MGLIYHRSEESRTRFQRHRALTSRSCRGDSDGDFPECSAGRVRGDLRQNKHKLQLGLMGPMQSGAGDTAVHEVMLFTDLPQQADIRITQSVRPPSFTHKHTHTHSDSGPSSGPWLPVLTRTPSEQNVTPQQT
ncbi:hypothetical protein MHYP_G00243050 [Metynnis hypsauchen]